jgi:hypothetical protein
MLNFMGQYFLVGSHRRIEFVPSIDYAARGLSSNMIFVEDVALRIGLVG